MYEPTTVEIDRVCGEGNYRSQSDLFIAPDGSMFTFVQTDPSSVTSGVELQGTAKRVGD